MKCSKSAYSDHVHYGRCVGDIYLNLNLSGLSKFQPTHKKMYMPRKKNLFTFCMLFQMAHWLWPRVMSGDLINVIGTEIFRFDPEIMDREFEKKMVPKIFFYIYIQKWSAAWGPHKWHRNRNPQVRSWDNGPRIWKEMVQKKIIYFFYNKNCLRPGDLINVIGTEILRSVPEIMDREFEKNGPKKIYLFFL